MAADAAAGALFEDLSVEAGGAVNNGQLVLLVQVTQQAKGKPPGEPDVRVTFEGLGGVAALSVEVESFIAKGSFGAVWKAVAPDGRAFALKVG